MWKTLHKHLARQDKNLLLREPETRIVCVLEGSTEDFYLHTVSVLCLMVQLSQSQKIHQLICASNYFKTETWKMNQTSKQPRCFWHNLPPPPTDGDDQMLRGMGAVWFSCACAGARTQCQSAEMLWLSLLGSCLLPLLHQMIWKPWPFSHVCDNRTIKRTGVKASCCPKERAVLCEGKKAHTAQAPPASSYEDVRYSPELLSQLSEQWWHSVFGPDNTALNSCGNLVLPCSELTQCRN